MICMTFFVPINSSRQNLGLKDHPCRFVLKYPPGCVEAGDTRCAPSGNTGTQRIAVHSAGGPGFGGWDVMK